MRRGSRQLKLQACELLHGPRSRNDDQLRPEPHGPAQLKQDWKEMAPVKGMDKGSGKGDR